MLLIHGILATALRSWDAHTTEFKSKPTEPSNLSPAESFQGTASWNGAAQESIQKLESECATPASASSEGEKTISSKVVHYSTPLGHSTSSNKPTAHDPYGLNATTFPYHAVHLLPSEPNGTWRTRASYAMPSSSESAPTLQDLFKDHVPELDIPTLYAKLKEVARDCRDDFEGWMNQKFAGTDLSEMHDRVWRAVRTHPMPNLRQIDQALPTMPEIGQSLRKSCSDSDLLKIFKNDKYVFADILSQQARRALIEQGICKKWQLQCKGYLRLQHVMQAALMHTFTHIQQVHVGVLLFRAKPHWTADREKRAWRLELDVGKVGIEVGPATDRSLIELGPIDTGFELPESCGCAAIVDIDRHTQGVDDEWQLLEV